MLPLSSTAADTAGTPSASFDAERFLVETLPSLLREGSERASGLAEGVLQFLLSDVPQATCWYRISSGTTVEVHAGVHPCPSLTLLLRRRELRKLTEDDLDFSLALSRGHLRVFGDLSLLRWFAQRLSTH